MFALHEVLQEEYRLLHETEEVRVQRVTARDPLQVLTEEDVVQRYLKSYVQLLRGL